MRSFLSYTHRLTIFKPHSPHNSINRLSRRIQSMDKAPVSSRTPGHFRMSEFTAPATRCPHIRCAHSNILKVCWLRKHAFKHNSSDRWHTDRQHPRFLTRLCPANLFHLHDEIIGSYCRDSHTCSVNWKMKCARLNIHINIISAPRVSLDR